MTALTLKTETPAATRLSKSNPLTRCTAALLGITLVAALPGRGLAADATPFTAYAPGKGEVSISHDGGDYFRFGVAVWGPNWGWGAFKGDSSSAGGVAVSKLTTVIGGVRPKPKNKEKAKKAAAVAATPAATLHLDVQAKRTSPSQLLLDYNLRAEQETDLTMVAVTLAPAKIFQGKEIVAESGGKPTKLTLPFARGSLGDAVSVLRLTDPASAQTVLHFDPPCAIDTDGPSAKLVLAREHIKAGATRHQTITVDLPAATAWYASADEIPNLAGFNTWYPWKATGAGAGSLFNMSDWLEKPAGKFGRIQHEGENLIYNGQPIKLWGINVCYANCAPDKVTAEKNAALFARYGINAVRLHKFADGSTWDGIQSKESMAEYDPAGLDRMDYQIAKLKEAGIYVELSSHFGTVPLGPGDRRDVPFMDEFGSASGKSLRVRAPASAFYYSPELQNVQIRQIVNLLTHKNPYTGKTYAEETSISSIEIINEQSILFFTSSMPLKQSPTIRKQVGQRFTAWLLKKYGGEAGLKSAWGDKAFGAFTKEGGNENESVAQQNILPIGNPYFWDPTQLDVSPNKRRSLDTLQFLYELQNEANDRYVAAVRKAGYTGEILGSNWQAGRGYSHFANLNSDARIGLIDRHNYFGGGKGRTILGKFPNATMISRAGSGMLSAGLQQVSNLPFMLSEWIHVTPNEWGAEGVSILGAYGYGLQGWDVSYIFESKKKPEFSNEIRAKWDAMTPQILGVFPAVSRQVLRGDVQESSVVSVRSVHMPSLFDGKLGFQDELKQGYDDKELGGAQVPARALAAVRCVVQFTNHFETTPKLDLKPYEQDGMIVSATKQLRWKEGANPTDGFFTINTEATKAVVGFAENQVCKLGDVSITPQTHYAAIYVSALEKTGKIATSKHLLVTAIARSRNTGMKFNLAGNELLETGEAPLLVEPVKATVAIAGRRITGVQLLDHDGRPTGKTLPVADGQFTINGATDKTPYYEVTCE